MQWRRQQQWSSGGGTTSCAGHVPTLELQQLMLRIGISEADASHTVERLDPLHCGDPSSPTVSMLPLLGGRPQLFKKGLAGFLHDWGAI
eukprot:4563775-Amphidinium_carterae.2